MKKESIALVIREPHGAGPAVPACGPGPRWLLVRRPDDDEDLPGVWGLPAGTRRLDETDEDLVRRIGREKLGVEVEPGAAVAAGSADRATYRLNMRLWSATIVEGEPTVDVLPDDKGRGVGGEGARSPVTRYAACRWDDPSALAEGAGRGSLCCRLGVELASTGPR